MKKCAIKWEKGNIPRVIIWDIHRDRVVNLDPLSPVLVSAGQSWVDLSLDVCAQLRTSWSAHELSPPTYGFEVPHLLEP